jgi:hypothetical protein
MLTPLPRKRFVAQRPADRGPQRRSTKRAARIVLSGRATKTARTAARMAAVFVSDLRAAPAAARIRRPAAQAVPGDTARAARHRSTAMATSASPSSYVAEQRLHDVRLY